MAPSHSYLLLPALAALAACDSPLDALSDASVAATDARVVDARPGEDIDAAPLVDGPKPIMIAAANYLEFHDELAGLGPFQVYAWATDPAISNPNRYQQELGYLQQIDEPGVEEMIMFSSHATLAQKLAIPGHAQQLKDLGVSILGYNTEGFMTPAGEMNGIGNPSAEQNPIAIYASLAAAEGFETFWGPIRVTADAVSSDAIAAMKLGGLNGVALQEQQFIESACVAERVAAVTATANTYRAVAGADMGVNVQIMPSRCLTGDAYAAANCGSTPAAFAHCAQFVADIDEVVTSYAIWASSPDDRANFVPLIRAMRAP